MPALKKRTKIILYIVGGVILALTIAGMWIAGHYKSIIKKQIPLKVAKATDSLYRIDFEKININLLSRKVRLRNVHFYVDTIKLNSLKTDSVAPRHYVDLRVPELYASSIMWDEAVGGNGFSIGNFTISDPDIQIFKLDSAFCKNDTVKKKKKRKDLTISNLDIENGNIKYYPKIHKDSSAITFKGMSIALENWKSQPQNDSIRFLMAEEGIIDIDSIVYDIPNSEYRFSIVENSFNSNTRRFTAKDARIKLKISNEAFFKKANVQKEIYDIHLPTVEMDDIEWQTLFTDKELRMSNAYFNHLKVNVLFNRTLPENHESKLGKYPNQLLQKLKLPLLIKKVHLNNSDISYTEISNRTGKKGSINFSNAEGLVKNISNIKSITDSNNKCIAELSGKFNKYSDINAVFTFVLDDPNGSFALNTVMRNLQAHQINQQSKAFTLIAIKSLNMKKMTLDLHGNEDYAEADFTMLYNNMSIQILKEDVDENGDKKKKGFLTFVANNMLLYSNNPMPGKEVRNVHTYLNRTKEKSFFNLIWKNIHQGVQQTCIRNLGIIDWMKKNEEKALNNGNKMAEDVFDPDK